MKNHTHWRTIAPGSRLWLMFCLLTLWSARSDGQQFNSDSYLSKAHGTITLIPTIGERSTMLMNTYSLFPRWEFTMAMYLYDNDFQNFSDDGYSTSLYAKYMFYENKSRTGGWAIKAGTGLFPGVLKGDTGGNDAFKTYWMNAPGTIPFLHNKLQWDIMPGASVTRDYGADSTTAWAFTYSTRVAWYALHPEWAFVAETFGSKGETENIPEFKIGVRWEPSPYSVFAITYGQEFEGRDGAGFEFGVMLFTPPFACLGGCGDKRDEGGGLLDRKPKSERKKKSNKEP